MSIKLLGCFTTSSYDTDFVSRILRRNCPIKKVRSKKPIFRNHINKMLWQGLNYPFWFSGWSGFSTATKPRTPMADKKGIFCLEELKSVWLTKPRKNTNDTKTWTLRPENLIFGNRRVTINKVGIIKVSANKIRKVRSCWVVSATTSSPNVKNWTPIKFANTRHQLSCKNIFGAGIEIPYCTKVPSECPMAPAAKAPITKTGSDYRGRWSWSRKK